MYATQGNANLPLSARRGPTRDGHAGSQRLTLNLAESEQEVREAQALRYRVFIEGGRLHALANPERLDRDDLDPLCDHLIVRDTGNGRVVGTYRLLHPQAARIAGRLYCEAEFDLAPLQPLRGRLVEAGRACIDPEYRSGAVIMLLWAGIAAYMKRHGCEYLAGCASISLADGGATASAAYREIAVTHLAPPQFRVRPHHAFPLQEGAHDQNAQIPPLLKGYLRSGAWICGEPALDPEFDCADLLVLLPLSNLDGRYAKRYLGY